MAKASLRSAARMLKKRIRAVKRSGKTASLARTLKLAQAREDARKLAPAQEQEDTRKLALAQVQEYGHRLTNLQRFARDPDIVLAAVKQNGMALRHADPDLRGDFDIAFAAVQQDGNALQYVGRNLKANRDIVLAAIQRSGCVLQFADPALSRDMEFLMSAVTVNGLILSYLGGNAKTREIVMAAVRQNGQALCFADVYQDDDEIVLAAVKQTPGALLYANRRFYASRDVMLAATQQDGHSIVDANDTLLSDQAFLLEAIERNSLVMHVLQLEHRRLNAEFQTQAVRKNPSALQYAELSIQVSYAINKTLLENWPEGDYSEMVRVERMSGDELNLPLIDRTVSNIKDILFGTLGVPVGAQRLLLEHRALLDKDEIPFPRVFVRVLNWGLRNGENRRLPSLSLVVSAA